MANKAVVMPGDFCEEVTVSQNKYLPSDYRPNEEGMFDYRLSRHSSSRRAQRSSSLGEQRPMLDALRQQRHANACIDGGPRKSRNLRNGTCPSWPSC